MERIASGDHHVSYKLGGLTLTSLRDGYVDMPVTRLRKPQNTIFETDLPPQIPLVDGKLRLSVNAFALDDGEWVTLIDTGASNAWLPSMGLLPQALSEAKIAPERIRTVAFTHTHIDHINGLILPNGRDAFPQLSRLLVPKAELALFRAEARLEHSCRPSGRNPSSLRRKYRGSGDDRSCLSEKAIHAFASRAEARRSYRLFGSGHRTGRFFESAGHPSVFAFFPPPPPPQAEANRW